MGLLNIWNSIKDKVVNASNAVFGAAKSVRKGVGSVAGKAKNIILRRDEGLQEVINDCVKSLNELLNSEQKDKITLLNGVLKAFRGMMGTDKFENFYRGCGSTKKGFAGFAKLLSDYIGKDSNPMKGVESINKSNVEGKVGDTVLRILSRVERYGGFGSRVNAFIGPCKKLYRAASGIGGSEEDSKLGSYFDKACECLSSAASVSEEDEFGFDGNGYGEFCGFMCDAYDAVCKMCKYEKLGKKGNKNEQTASGKWYSECNGKTTYNEKIEAVLAICDDEYKSDRGFAKKYLKFKGQTKWQKLRAFVAKAKKNGMKISVIGSSGKLSVGGSGSYSMSTGDFGNYIEMKDMQSNDENS